ncbi:auxin-responsive protein iaa26 [Phtheirospermum japonicum]|uniref:Auxin-responsive protein n=1 Tax=Phtheirospermum japonicum TaxID=374723 RepID=A0A830BGI7_9LAMI|nr:auxin-responsive protein iaa26 [Phtheirospermum japonicum]
MEGYRLELSLGPPGGEWAVTDDNSSRVREHESLLSLGYFSKNHCARNPSFLHLQPGAVMKDASQACNSRLELQTAEKKAFSVADPAKYTANSAQKRTAPAPVVGWPPIRSFRKNIASGSSSKVSSESPDAGPNKVSGGPKTAEKGPRGLFVKINMDGVPIGRKVDLKTYDTQSESCAGGMKDNKDECKAIGCLLDGSGEYTLVYEDNEGDKMLVGDVPWHMFVSTVKRLRVLKSSELTTLSRGSKQGKVSLDA